MKKTFILLSTLILLVSAQSCWYEPNDEVDIVNVDSFELSMYNPVYMTRDALQESVAITPSKSIENSGKIYVKDNFLFIGEKYEGFHVFNNANPANPNQIAFIQVPGATDIAIKNDVIYINNAIDLVALQMDYASETIQITKRIENAFPQMLSPDGYQFYEGNDQIIVNWTLKE
ncbi:hypothetical protein [Neptunitalea lumnitzerae]|uniref:LVIVD repeat-containing protein n=1 Tax=Neptunitalea lumnitzerae TaxID=2965509 RepID=A0ABQ5MJU3_9FLAO|nr:hypothetical protein [Neptunitalea sp. Y10]GLB49197.1 hypothetical protein Y10_15650 [Neptunitalea sp. Y10]